MRRPHLLLCAQGVRKCIPHFHPHWVLGGGGVQMGRGLQHWGYAHSRGAEHLGGGAALGVCRWGGPAATGVLDLDLDLGLDLDLD